MHVPAPEPRSALVHRKLAFQERPTVTVAVNVTVRDGLVAVARIAVGSVCPRPARVVAAEQALLGVEARSAALELGPCAEAAADEVEPVADAAGSVEYKRQLVRVLTRRCAERALAEASAQAA